MTSLSPGLEQWDVCAENGFMHPWWEGLKDNATH